MNICHWWFVCVIYLASCCTSAVTQHLVNFILCSGSKDVSPLQTTLPCLLECLFSISFSSLRLLCFLNVASLGVVIHSQLQREMCPPRAVVVRATQSFPDHCDMGTVWGLWDSLMMLSYHHQTWRHVAAYKLMIVGHIWKQETIAVGTRGWFVVQLGCNDPQNMYHPWLYLFPWPSSLDCGNGVWTMAYLVWEIGAGHCSRG